MEAKKKSWFKPDFGPTEQEIIVDNVKDVTNLRSRNSTKESTKFNVAERSKLLEFIQRYEPQDIGELVVNKTKLREIESALLNAMQQKKFLLIHGPAGCGKTTTIRLLAKKFHFKIIDWRNDVTFRAVTFGYNNAQISACNQCSDFFDFLRNSQKTSNLQLCNYLWDSHRNIHLGDKKLILVEEYPCMLTKNQQEFWSCLRSIKTGILNFPTIFICNLEDKSRDQSGASGNYSDFSRLFADDILQEFSFAKINMNPITQANMIKLLRNVLQQSGINLSVDRFSKFIEEIAASSKGDARAALLNLQFQLCAFLTTGNIELPMDENSTALRDQNANLFSCLGKFLYSKRIGEEYILLDNSRNLPDHIKQFCLTKRLSFDPEDILDQCGMNSTVFSAYLHENYLNLLSDRCAANLDLLVEVSSNFRLSDILSAFENKERLNACIGSLVGRSVAFYMQFLLQNTPVNDKVGSGYRQIKKSSFGRELSNVKELAGDQLFTSNFNEFLLDWAPYLTILQPDNRRFEQLSKFDVKKCRNYRIAHNRFNKFVKCSTLLSVDNQSVPESELDVNLNEISEFDYD